MIINEKITVKNYKCFDKEGEGFDRLFPINLIIGKNNSGKSSLIDLIQYIIKPNEDFSKKGRDNTTAEVLVEHKLTEIVISQVFDKTRGGGGIPLDNHFEYGKNFVNRNYTYKIEPNGDKQFVKLDTDFAHAARNLFSALVGHIQSPFANKTFCHISAERDINPEILNTNNFDFKPNGSGATNYIQRIINSSDRDSRLIEKELLDKLNTIVNPDIIFTRILVQMHPSNLWEVFFEDAHNKRIALSKMGSGVKTVILVLLNLIVRPRIEYKKHNSYVFAFEELENNLHPSLQRRLYRFIKEYSENYSSYFFLTTHSNIVIDSFGTYKNSQLVHVTNNGDKSIASTILSYKDTKNILEDLGLKASDILQSNGVIWVEGPSDRNYINKWINLISPEFKEGLHYSIMFYGGRLLANLTFDFDWFNSDVIPLLKINRNAFVVIDRDGKTINAKLNETKIRISSEIGENNYWITKGREIENYLSDETITNWLKIKHNYNASFSNMKNQKLEDNILQSNNKIKLKYNLSKTVYSSEITDFIDSNTMDILDLKEKIYQLIEVIKMWNK
nr:AAA family ATPase [uncultured Draconibacterium sp.]